MFSIYIKKIKQILKKKLNFFKILSNHKNNHRNKYSIKFDERRGDRLQN